MKSRIIAIILILLLIMSSSIMCCAAESVNAYEIEKGVTLHMPDDWNEISSGMMDGIFEMAAGRSGSEFLKYSSMFQPEKTSYLGLPFLLVMKDTNVSKFRGLKRLKNINKEEFGRYMGKTDLYGMLQGVSVNDLYYDGEGKRLIMETKFDAGYLDSMIMLMDLQFTKKAVIILMFYCEESEYYKYREPFYSIIDNIEIAESARYTDRWFSPFAVVAAILAIGMTLFIVFHLKKGDTDDSSAGAYYRGPRVAYTGAAGTVDANNGSGQDGHTDWFCPKCRFGNSINSNVCENCNHSIV